MNFMTLNSGERKPEEDSTLMIICFLIIKIYFAFNFILMIYKI